MSALYADQDGWARKAILNVAHSGRFSSDRTIAEYIERTSRAAGRPPLVSHGREGCGWEYSAVQSG